MREPKITVLMPAYNAGKFIGEAIGSVLNQSFSDFELLIVNDGSTDDTSSVIQTFDDERIIVINQTNKGVAAALNIGLQYARASYVARFDADDICYPDRLKIQYEFITENPAFSIVGSGADYVDVSGDYVFTHEPAGFSNEQIQRLSYKICPFIHSGVLYRKETILGCGGYNERAYTYEDHFLWANILKNEKVCNLVQPLIKVRLNPDSITIDEKWRTSAFRSIKYSTLKKCFISESEGLTLLAIGKKQHDPRIKEGAYYALLGKKYLWNNYQPQKARVNLIKTLSISPFHFKNYFLLLLSFLSEKALTSIYKVVKTSAGNNRAITTNPLKERKELIDYDR